MTSQKKLIGVVVLLFFLFSIPAIAKKKPVARTPGPVMCTDLAGIIANEPGVQDATSQLYPLDEPEYCRVEILYGTNPDQNIMIYIGLPFNTVDGGSGGVQGNWNGRTVGNGGGGCSGTTSVAGVEAGYVGSGTDAGSDGNCEHGVNDNGTYNYQFINDFIRNGIKQQVLFSKSVAKSYYGMKPRYNYWNGCSTGGRQGYLLAQELGKELDGILANAPAIYWTRFQTAQMWGQIVMKDLVGYVIPSDKLNLATAAAVAACDADDGVEDGVIDDPRTCTYSAFALISETCTPADTDCLTPEEAQAIDMIWDGPRNAHGDKIWFGLDRGTALCSVMTFCGPPFAPPGECIDFYFGLNCPAPFSLGVIQFHWNERDLDFDWQTVSIDGYAQVAQDGSRNIADVTDTFGDLDKFRKSGGKMITYVGANDNLIMPGGVIHYYRQMASRYDYRRDHGSKKAGVKGHGNDVDFTGVQKFYRLFRAPGAGHCGASGSGPFDALVDWVENGNAPDQIDVSINGHPRRMCPYPETAIYDEGCGYPDDPDCYYCGGNLETTDTVCEDVLVKYKHEVKGPLDYTGTGFNQHKCYYDHRHGPWQ